MNKRRERKREKKTDAKNVLQSIARLDGAIAVCFFLFLYTRENIVKYTATTKIRLPVYYISLSINCEYNIIKI